MIQITRKISNNTDTLKQGEEHSLRPDRGKLASMQKPSTRLSHLTAVSTLLFDKQTFAKVEAYGTALVSMVDMATDIYMIHRYYSSGRQSYANATLMCVLGEINSSMPLTHLSNTLSLLA